MSASFPTPDHRAHHIARRQSGHISRNQVFECGLTPKQLRQRTNRGGWVTVLPSVYRLPGAPDCWEGRVQAVLLWAGAGRVLCGRTAGFLLGLDGIERPERIDLLTTSSTKAPGVRLHRVAPDDQVRIRKARGFPICEVERVLVQIAAELPLRRSGMALDSALRLRHTTLDRLRAFVDACPSGRPGVAAMRRLLVGRDVEDQKVRSEFEARMLRILRRMKGLTFVSDHPIVVDGERFVLDFFIPAGSLGVECHSFRWHIAKHTSDVRRERKIRAAGIDLIYFTWDDVTFDAKGVERDLRDRLAKLCSNDAL